MKLVVKLDFAENSFIGKAFLKGSVSDVRTLLVHLLTAWSWDFEYYFERD